MARDFSKNTSNYMSLGANALGPLLNGAANISMHCWANFDSFNGSAGSTGDDMLFVAINGGTAGVGFNIRRHASNGTDILSIGGRSVSTDTFRFQDGVTDINTGAWYSLGGVLQIGADNIRVYVNGVQDVSGISGTWANATYTNGTPTTVDGIGAAFSGSTPISTARQADGRIAEVAIWNADIGTDGFAALAARISAALVRPDALVFYMPLLGFDSPERDHWGGKSGTITGTVAAADHHNIIYPAGVINVQKATAASSVTGRLIGGRLIGGHLTRSRLVGI